MTATYTVGDGKTYATIQAAVDAIPGNLAGQGLQTVEVYAKAATSNVYGAVDAYTGFSNASAADHIILQSMVAHGGYSQAAGGTGILISGVTSFRVVFGYYYTEVYDFEVGVCSNINTVYGIDVLRYGKVKRNIIHDITNTANTGNVFGILCRGSVECWDNVIYDLLHNGASVALQCAGIYTTDFNSNLIYNNTVYKIQKVANFRYGIRSAIGGDTIRNNYAHASSSNGDFVFSTSTHSNNISNDATGDITLKNPGNQFVSIVDGSEDFRLVSTADCVDAGFDLSGTFTTDIIGITFAVPFEVGCFAFPAVIGIKLAGAFASKSFKIKLSGAFEAKPIKVKGVDF